MKKLLLMLLTLTLAGFSLAFQGPNCDEDISLVNGGGCASPCCFQDPPNSGNYVFLHDAVEKIDIRNNGAGVVSVSFPNLVSVEKFIRISYNQPGAVTRISFPALRTAGRIEIVGNPGLVELDLPRLMSIDSEDYTASLKIQSNAGLSTLNVPLLDRITASEAGTAFLELRYNPALTIIDFPSLRTLEAIDDYGEAYVFISSNDQVQEVRMNKLQSLVAGVESISYLIVDNMLNLEHISFPHLRELLPSGGVNDFSELTVGHSPRLAEFVFPSLERVSLLQLSSLKGTSRAMFPNLSELQYLWIFNSCDSPESSLKMYICSEQTFYDTFFSNYDGLCGPNGYMLYSVNPDNRALCDASDVCQSFIPAENECKCGSPGLCTVSGN